MTMTAYTFNVSKHVHSMQSLIHIFAPKLRVPDSNMTLITSFEMKMILYITLIADKKEQQSFDFELYISIVSLCPSESN